jgi:V/A-type H+-transporting ATPase subunit I
MSWRERVQPVRMQRVALVAPVNRLRDMLVQVADAGSVDLDTPVTSREITQGEARRRLQRLPALPAPRAVLSRDAPDFDALENTGRADLLAGEAALEERASQAVARGAAAATIGWAPLDAVPELTARLALIGAATVPLPAPRGQDPPSLLTQRGAAGTFAPLVETYAVVPYADVNPSTLAGIAYVVMFGMMFADAGEGLLLVLAGVALQQGWYARLVRFRAAWPFLVGAGVASAVFGLLYGEFFGPTGVVPVVWLAPLDHTGELLASAIGVGAVLLAVAYLVGSVNRWREGTWRLALYAPTGIAGTTLFLALGLTVAGWYLDATWLMVLATVGIAAGLTLSFIGLLSASGGGIAGVTQAAIELFDLVIRLGSNLLSFARLAAFGLTHAALGSIVWDATRGLGRGGALAMAGAVVVFVVGNTVSFALEALVAAVQALRLEYYELFSRVFTSEGRPFHPWHIPIVNEEAGPCLSG